MIIFKDENNDSVMSFYGLNDSFYIELAKIDEEAYANGIHLEKDEVEHLIIVLTKHLETQK